MGGGGLKTSHTIVLLFLTFLMLFVFVHWKYNTMVCNWAFLPSLTVHWHPGIQYGGGIYTTEMGDGQTPQHQEGWHTSATG